MKTRDAFICCVIAGVIFALTGHPHFALLMLVVAILLLFFS